MILQLLYRCLIISRRPTHADSYLNGDDSREKSSSIGNNDPSREELRCVIGIFRHGDRTPKEKLKIKTKNSKWISLHKRFANSQGTN